jgi:hypothetical protein
MPIWSTRTLVSPANGATCQVVGCRTRHQIARWLVFHEKLNLMSLQYLCPGLNSSSGPCVFQCIVQQVSQDYSQERNRQVQLTGRATGTDSKHDVLLFRRIEKWSPPFYQQSLNSTRDTIKRFSTNLSIRDSIAKIFLIPSFEISRSAILRIPANGVRSS